MAAKKKAARARREPAFDEDDDGPGAARDGGRSRGAGVRRCVAGETAQTPCAQEAPCPRHRRALRPHCLLGPGGRPVARHRLHRPHHLGRRTFATDPIAGNSEAAAFDPDRRHTGARARAPRRSRRRAVAAAGNAQLRAEGIHRHRGPPLLTNITASTRSASGALSSPTSCTAPSRKAARPSRSSSPRISS